METPRLSPSIASILLRRSPLHAWHAHRLLGGGKRDSTSAMENGSLIHALLLGGRDIVELPFNDFRTNAAKEARDAVLAGKIGVLAPKLDEAKNKAEIIRKRMGIVLEAAEREKRIEWESDGVLCSGQVDAMSNNSIVELKTIDEASPFNCRRSIEMYDYHVQGAAYLEGTGLPRLVFYFCESDAPNDVTPFELSGSLLELGQRRWRRAKAMWRACLESNDWPGAAGGSIVKLPASDFALSREEDEI